MQDLDGPDQPVPRLCRVHIHLRKRWLNRVEAITAFLLLLIPYFTKGYDISMAGTARFVSAIFPLYLVLGNILARLPPPLAAGCLAVSGFLLGLYFGLVRRLVSVHLIRS